MPFEGSDEIADKEMLLFAFGAIATSDDEKLTEAQEILRNYLFPIEIEVQK